MKGREVGGGGKHIPGSFKLAVAEGRVKFSARVQHLSWLSYVTFAIGCRLATHHTVRKTEGWGYGGGVRGLADLGHLVWEQQKE